MRIVFETTELYAFFEEVTPNKKYKNKMSSDIGSVSDDPTKVIMLYMPCYRCWTEQSIWVLRDYIR